ncbi:hypothetical protein [Streptomyces sp. NPDC056987]|uniref:hypothetical protein n=1 Tax=Streptomyces sp. NPDC056987 TaxID=3345988 RepID=UPI00364565D3
MQLVLGDLDSRTARRTPLDAVRRLADQYEGFALGLGFDLVVVAFVRAHLVE